MTSRSPHLVELGHFLRSRRDELAPKDIGLTRGEKGAARRRVKGLRREEIADFVAISRDYYTRIEQGRLAPSHAVLTSIADALRLTPVQRTYVEGLVRHAEGSAPPGPRTGQVRPQIQRLLDQLVDTPAMVLGKHLDILAWNSLMAALLIDFGEIAQQERNYVRMVFTHPSVRMLFPNWEDVARTSVAVLRMEAREHPADPQLAGLVDELSLLDPQFRQWWTARHVAQPDFGSKTIRHPDVGVMTFDWNIFRDISDPDLRLQLWSPATRDGTFDKLRVLLPRDS
ncbi:hypothetical protein AU196_03885 [Mycobacterium sp. IS-1742]|uniref:helix-turn-helix domain-containing protein n=1 Tax=Mycobacterium sp. IS-1742 TaxID=1772285 RepID=UPI0007400832|nr:helix-turn-helix transcriptional regulator [Mycobacterium sp. IS-1742]KUI29481.1 hypothetical protein AU196_03885 [Mycobacterium sp. IS-1742]